MLKRRTILATGLGFLLSLAAVAPVVADQERGNRHSSGNRPQATAPYLKTDHRRDYRGHNNYGDRNHRPHWKQHRHAYRNHHGHHRGHSHYRQYRHGHDHKFANGLVFGGVLGYIIGNHH